MTILIAVIAVGIYAFVQPKNEERQVIPANIGLSPTCIRPIHTHDATGTIHVETNQDRDYTLGDFFLIWGKTFNSSGIFADNPPLPTWDDQCVPAGASLIYHAHPVLTIILKHDAPNTITMTVNGDSEPKMQSFQLPRDTTANPTNIVITYGPGVPVSL